MGQKNLLYLYSGPRLEWQWATKAGHSSVILEWSWTEAIVLRNKVFGQGLIESCVLAENHKSKSAIFKVVFDCECSNWGNRMTKFQLISSNHLGKEKFQIFQREITNKLISKSKHCLYKSLFYVRSCNDKHENNI